MAGLFLLFWLPSQLLCITHSWLHSLALQREIFCTGMTCVGGYTGSWRPGQHTIKHNQASQFAFYHVLQTSQKVKVGMSWEQSFLSLHDLLYQYKYTKQLGFSQAIHILAVSCNFRVSTSCLNSQCFLLTACVLKVDIYLVNELHLPNSLCKLEIADYLLSCPV